MIEVHVHVVNSFKTSRTAKTFRFFNVDFETVCELIADLVRKYSKV